MKERKRKLIALFTFLAVAAGCLTSCTDSEKTEENTFDTHYQTTGQVSFDGEKEPTTENESYTLQIKYYEGLIKELEDKLLSEKEQNYITLTEYKQQIAYLQTSIDALNSKINQNAQASSDVSSGIESNSSTDADVEKSHFLYKTEDGKVTVTKYFGAEKEVTVPKSFDGLPIVKIGEGAFSGSSVQKIVLQDGITHIDWFAFKNCSSLCEITIPPSVKSVGYGAFEYCRDKLIILCQEGSYIESYAASWGIGTIKMH